MTKKEFFNIFLPPFLAAVVFWAVVIMLPMIF